MMQLSVLRTRAAIVVCCALAVLAASIATADKANAHTHVDTIRVGDAAVTIRNYWTWGSTTSTWIVRDVRVNSAGGKTVSVTVYKSSPSPARTATKTGTFAPFLGLYWSRQSSSNAYVDVVITRRSSTVKFRYRKYDAYQVSP